MAKKEELNPLSEEIKEGFKEQPFWKKKIDLNLSFFRVSVLEKALFAKHLSVMLQAGLTLPDALEVSYEQAKGKFKRILNKVRQDVSKGQPLADAISNFPDVFNFLFVSMVKTGEISGTLDANLKNLADQLEKDLNLRRKVSAAMTYPIFVLSAAIILGFGMAIYVLPKMTNLFKSLDTELPPTTKALIAIADIFQNYGAFIVLGTIVFIIFFLWLVRKNFVHPITHAIILKIPLVSKISHNINLARFNRNLGLLLESGLTIDKALEITRDSLSNYYYKQKVDDALKVVMQGKPLTDALAESEDLFPAIATKMINVGEKTGSLESNLSYLAEYYEAEVDNLTKNLATILEPVLLLIIGFFVAGLALAVISPIYQITSGISSR